MPNSTAVRPIAPYLGGKRNLAKRLCAIIDATPHRTYVEPFVGMGGIFLRRGRAAPAEVINDISRDVSNLFRVVRRHFEPLVDELELLLTSRDEFERQRLVDPDTLTDIERAARFLYLQRISFGGKVTGRTFGVDRNTPSRFNYGKLRAEIRALGARLAPVTIERLPYADLIRRYDSGETLFYLDPPYWGCEDDYGADVFARGDFEQLADQLAGIRGKFVLSINATEGSRAVFSRFRTVDVDVAWSIATKAMGTAKRVTELVVSNIG
ncbi:DNA adenine methylase [Sphingomonas sp. BK235]|uniref:DNA adenine methylase n=1 Tax=Sphingomonas sp. BK235 TaxID=2512131 RepID=UPI001046FBA8|nr:DNA adenine methylase [Sphingomonas sp. BK235]TCP30678.1 DNA adenine methylase [Sphingomonas sp. BK235]